MYFSARWLVRADVHNGDTLVPAEVESDCQVISGEFRLIRDNYWTQLSTAEGNHIKIFRSLKLPVIGINNSTKVARLRILVSRNPLSLRSNTTEIS